MRIAMGAVLAIAACEPAPGGLLEATGAWADGTPIQFRAAALAVHNDQRASLSAFGRSVDRLRGIRLSFEYTFVPSPGAYNVDPKPAGGLEIYLVRPGEKAGDVTPANIEYEANGGLIWFDEVPSKPGGRAAGRFENIVLERGGTPILRLSQGTFETARR